MSNPNRSINSRIISSVQADGLTDWVILWVTPQRCENSLKKNNIFKQSKIVTDIPNFAVNTFSVVCVCVQARMRRSCLKRNVWRHNIVARQSHKSYSLWRVKISALNKYNVDRFDISLCTSVNQLLLKIAKPQQIFSRWDINTNGSKSGALDV
jgi:hypothetical protein